MRPTEALGFIRNQKTALVAVALASLILSGCEHQNEGSTTTGHMLFSSADAAKPYTEKLDQRFFLPSETGDLSLISQGDAYAVHIISAYICDFHEVSSPLSFTLSNSSATSCHNGSEGADSSGDTGTRGEIAMLMNVVERDGIGGQTTRRAGQRGAGRVVYYNTDVRESGQILNALNIPVHGPITYKGNPLFMELAILELDNEENEKTQQMLTSLASLGAAAYPPSGKALDILTSVSSVFLSGNQDDTEMRYQIEFDRAQPGTQFSTMHRMPLSEGYIAFLRSEDRSKDLSFRLDDPEKRAWKICPAQGFIADNKPQACEHNLRYRDRTWVLVRISKEDPTAASLLNVGENFATFSETLSGSSNISVSEVEHAILTTHGARMSDEADKLQLQIAEAERNRAKEALARAKRIEELEAERTKLRQELLQRENGTQPQADN